MLNAMADTTTHPGAAAALRVIASHALNSKVPLNRLIDLGPLGKMSKAQSREVVNVGVYQMLREVWRFQWPTPILYGPGGTLPCLTSTKIMLVIGDRPAKTPLAGGDPKRIGDGSDVTDADAGRCSNRRAPDGEH